MSKALRRLVGDYNIFAAGFSRFVEQPIRQFALETVINAPFLFVFHSSPL
jgi:hypothetical protein